MTFSQEWSASHSSEYSKVTTLTAQGLRRVGDGTQLDVSSFYKSNTLQPYLSFLSLSFDLLLYHRQTIFYDHHESGIDLDKQ